VKIVLFEGRFLYRWNIKLSIKPTVIGAGIDQYSAELRARWSGVRIAAGMGISLFTTASRPALGPTQPPIQCVPRTLSLRIKRLGRDADHKPTASAEVKNVLSYTSTPQYAFMAWCLIKHRDNFTFKPTAVKSVERWNLIRNVNSSSLKI
jgi:hypothetical protein